MEKKKMKIWKKVIIAILIILIIYLITVLIKFSILTNISNKYEESQKLDNYYYYSQTDETIMIYMQKDNIRKMNVIQVNDSGNMILWKNEESGEELVFWENDKKYSENSGGMITTLPCSTLISGADNGFTRFIISLNPTLIITSENDNYKLSYFSDGINTKEFIDQKTGLLIAIDENGNEKRTVEYKLGDVTDEDVAKPDITQYEYVAK